MEDYEARENIKLLSEKIGRFHVKAHEESRELTAQEFGFVTECEAEINELRKQLPERPLTVQNGPLTSDFQPVEKPWQAITPAQGIDYRSMFGLTRSGSLDSAGFKDCAEFLRVIDSGRYDPRLAV